MPNNLIREWPSKEASELGFIPGVWPISFVYNGVEFKRGSYKYTPDQEVAFVQYVSGDFLTMIVYND